jgi:hypothetical protein
MTAIIRVWDAGKRIAPVSVAGNTENTVLTFRDLLAALIINIIYEGTRYSDDYSDRLIRRKANES